MKPEILSINYCIELPAEDFLAFWKKLDYTDEVGPAMHEAGAMNIEYDGHFGPNIFFTSEATEVDSIVEVVKKLLVTAKARKHNVDGTR